jgi:hypothetical protein
MTKLPIHISGVFGNLRGRHDRAPARGRRGVHPIDLSIQAERGGAPRSCEGDQRRGEVDRHGAYPAAVRLPGPGVRRPFRLLGARRMGGTRAVELVASSATVTGGGRSRPGTPAWCRSRWTKARVGRAGGTPYALCGCSAATSGLIRKGGDVPTTPSGVAWRCNARVAPASGDWCPGRGGDCMSSAAKRTAPAVPASSLLDDSVRQGYR